MPLGPGARRAIAVLAGMVVLLVTGAVPAAMAGLLAATALIVLRVLDVEQCYRAISWTTVVLIAGMIPLSTAMIQTGAAEHLAEAIVDAAGSAGPHVLLLALVLLTPVATPANLMVMGPGGCWRLGLPLIVLFVAAAVLWVPLIWRF